MTSNKKITAKNLRLVNEKPFLPPIYLYLRVWPDLAKFGPFGHILKILAKL